MIVIKLQGGLGNQMFQYAFGRAISKRKKTPLFLDKTFLLDKTPRKDFVFRNYDLDIFNIRVSFIDDSLEKLFFPSRNNALYYYHRIFKKLASYEVYDEKFFHFDKGVFDTSINCYYNGYWQSYKYFSGIEADLKNDFNLDFSIKNEEYGHDIKESILNSNSVCLNVRRGDFVSNPKSIAFHGFVGVDFYFKSVKYISDSISHPSIFIFSDDIEWCKENLKFDLPTFFISHEFAGHKFSKYLYLMTLCKHFIIPNSTFAWWAAWLSRSESKIVICPKKWFLDESINTYDLIPSTWIRL